MSGFKSRTHGLFTNQGAGIVAQSGYHNLVLPIKAVQVAKMREGLLPGLKFLTNLVASDRGWAGHPPVDPVRLGQITLAF